jgi:hypothetical protein
MPNGISESILCGQRVASLRFPACWATYGRQTPGPGIPLRMPDAGMACLGCKTRISFRINPEIAPLLAATRGHRGEPAETLFRRGSCLGIACQAGRMPQGTRQLGRGDAGLPDLPD